MSQPKPWMSRTQKLLSSIALLAGVAFAIACGSGPQQPVPTQFSGYPMSEALKAVIQTHTDAGTDREKRVLLTTWFQDGDPQVARFMSIRPEGKCSTYQYVHQMEFRSASSKQLSPETVALILDATRELPPTQKPPLANMFIISFRNAAGVWDTRLYDRFSRPAALSTVIETTGAPIDP
jgi:hypothetical protein